MRSFADSYFPEAVPGDSPALTGGGKTLDYARLFADSSPGGTALLGAAMPYVRPGGDELDIWRQAFALTYSVVLVEAGMEVGESLLTGERIARRLEE